MSFTFVKQLPSPDQIKAQTPMSEEMKKLKAERDRLIQDVITGKSDKFLVIIGPCSADNEDSVCEYTNRLAKVQDKVADRLVLVPRIYTNKPRTTGEGYKGMLHLKLLVFSVNELALVLVVILSTGDYYA